jgi:hypothetical protein
MSLSEVLVGTAALLAAFAVARMESTNSKSAHSKSAHSKSAHSKSAHSKSAHSKSIGEPAAMQPLTHSVIASPPPAFTHGRARMIHAPTPCDVSSFATGGPGAPYFVTDGVPRAGMPFRVDWTTKPTSPGEPPAFPAMLLVSFQIQAPTPMDVVGAPGCHLMVEPEFIMVPHAGSILTQSGGRVRLDWTPHASVIGQEFYSQLLVTVPGGNAGGFLVSPALHVVVGS